MLTQLFGNTVILTTQFEFLSIDDKVSVEPEYYYTDRFKFFDFWYNPQQNWLPQLAFAISDYYHELSGTPGDKRTTASKMLQSLSDRKHQSKPTEPLTWKKPRKKLRKKQKPKPKPVCFAQSLAHSRLFPPHAHGCSDSSGLPLI